MTSTEIATRQHSLTEKIEYAEFLAKSNLLPRDFREHPENVLYAYEYGELLGLHPMAAITGIHVIEGKPSISAGLISALVRRAGHRLRVEGNGNAARCQIIRSDDPGFTYSAVWDMERAKMAGLLAKSNWQRYPAAMLKARAISEAARDACQEVLLGMAYTPDELGADDEGGEVIHDGFPAAPDGRLAQHEMSEEEKEAAGLMTRAQRVAHEALRRDGTPPAGAVQVTSEPDENDPWTRPPPEPKPKGQPAPPAAVAAMEDEIARLQLGPRGDVDALIAWRCPGWTATRGQVKDFTDYLKDHLNQALKAQGGDMDEALAVAASAIWRQYREAQARDAGEPAEAGDA